MLGALGKAVAGVTIGRTVLGGFNQAARAKNLGLKLGGGEDHKQENKASLHGHQHSTAK